MLHDTQRTSAPRSVSVSMRTAVCTVMCSEPMIFAPLSGFLPLYSFRSAIRPGISCSARRISFRPNSARDMSATLYGVRPASFAEEKAVFGSAVVATVTSVMRAENGVDGRRYSVDGDQALHTANVNGERHQRARFGTIALAVKRVGPFADGSAGSWW